MTDDEALEALVGMSLSRAAHTLGLSRTVVKDMLAKSGRFTGVAHEGAIVIRRRGTDVDDLVALLQRGPMSQGAAARELSISPHAVRRLVEGDRGERVIVTTGARGAKLLTLKRDGRATLSGATRGAKKTTLSPDPEPPEMDGDPQNDEWGV